MSNNEIMTSWVMKIDNAIMPSVMILIPCEVTVKPIKFAKLNLLKWITLHELKEYYEICSSSHFSILLS